VLKSVSKELDEIKRLKFHVQTDKEENYQRETLVKSTLRHEKIRRLDKIHKNWK